MKLTQKEVEHVANLARLYLHEDELEQMTAQLDTILAYVDKLEALDTSDVEPTTHAFPITNAFREDRVVPSLTQKDALCEGPVTNEENFIVPRVI